MFMFTASELKRKKNKKGNNNNSSSDYNDTQMVVMVTNRSFKTFMTLYLTGSVSNGKCIV